MSSYVTDGNDAAASVAYAFSEVIAIYPITPASPMGESSDQWASSGRLNLWGSVPRVIEMQSEAGAAGTLHGALLKGSLATTFTASQGLLLMLPNMFKIAGELTPTVIHVAARTIATHALSIFGDHSDVMAARSTGWAMLASVLGPGGARPRRGLPPRDAADPGAVPALLRRLPHLPRAQPHRDHRRGRPARPARRRGRVRPPGARPDPDAPTLRGTAQNPDVFFQAREAANPFHDAVPGAVQAAMDRSPSAPVGSTTSSTTSATPRPSGSSC
jgi:pyruvate-ferredoxin/flavodoxin oxidoreductase